MCIIIVFYFLYYIVLCIYENSIKNFLYSSLSLRSLGFCFINTKHKLAQILSFAHFFPFCNISSVDKMLISCLIHPTH